MKHVPSKLELLTYTRAILRGVDAAASAKKKPRRRPKPPKAQFNVSILGQRVGITIR